MYDPQPPDVQNDQTVACADARATVVEMADIWKAFDDFQALSGASLELQAGEIHALLGENGAGKTTLSNVLTGIYRPDVGTIRLDGEQRRFHSPAQAIAAGLGMVHQHFRLVEPLTVAENIHLGRPELPRRLSPRRLISETAQAMEQYGLTVNPTARIWQLSIGEQQRVEILRVLLRGARVLILDEPTAVLTPSEATELFAVLRRLAASGRTIVFISHKLHEVLAVSDRVTILRRGMNVATRPAAKMTPEKLAKLMTGTERVMEARRPSKGRGKPVLELRNVSARGDRGLVSVREASCTVHEGEIVGVAGVSGNGQRELTEIATGLRHPFEGTVAIDGQDLTARLPGDFVSAGVGHVPEDRIGSAIVPSATVVDNAVLRAFRTGELSRAGVMRRGAVRVFTDRLVTAADVQLPDIDVPIANLSGGNQQRFVARREAWAADRLLVAAHPTRGLDVRAADQVREVVLDRRDAGCAVLLVSDDLDELLAVSDRIVVMYEGRIKGDFTAAKARRKEIGYLMGGGDLVGGAGAEAPS
ncbi:MAG: ABC transporter ATP-binding protein [Solirubrobacteraceae bacterium]|nr:ABC transporter ATP-binding protein [Solirubrobacteraceae bacterium]